MQYWSMMPLTLLLTIGVAYMGRHGPTGRRSSKTARFLGYGLLLSYASYVLYRISEGYRELRYELPMELCNRATFVTSIALLPETGFQQSYPTSG